MKYLYFLMFVILIICLFGCGEGPVLQAGIYDVVGVQKSDTCGLEDNDLINPSWYVDYVDDYYGIKHTKNDSTISGPYDGDKIRLSKEEWDMAGSCEVSITTDIILDPYGSSFDGTMTNYYLACDGDSCLIEWVIEGMKRKSTDTYDPTYY